MRIWPFNKAFKPRVKESDWDQFLGRLVDETKAAIQRFANEHPDEEVCYFAYDSEPRYGYVRTCFNTSIASLQFARKQLEYHTEYRRRLMESPTWIKHAFYQAKANALLPFCDNLGDFAYQGFTEIAFPEWQRLADAPDYPQPKREDDDYLINRVARLFCRATDRLVIDGAFEQLRLANPTMIGFGLHDHPTCILHLLRLPEDA